MSKLLSSFFPVWPQANSSLYSTLVAFFAIIQVVLSATVIFPPESGVASFAVAMAPNPSVTLPYVGNISIVRGSGCNELLPTDIIGQVEGNIMLLERRESCSFLQKANIAKLAGARVLLLASSRQPGSFINTEDYEFPLAVGELPLASFSLLADLLEEHGVATIQVDRDTNTWRDFWESPTHLGLQIVMMLVMAAQLPIMVMRLAQFWSYYGTQVSIPQLTLIFEGVGCILRFVHWMNPAASSKLWGIGGYAFFELGTFSVPISIITSLMCAMYWFETLQRYDFSISTFLKRCRFLFFVLSGLVWASHTAAAFCTGFRAPGILIIIFALIDGCAFIAVSIYFIIIGAKMLQQIKITHARSGSIRVSRLRRITIYLLISAIGMIGFVATFFAVPAANSQSDPVKTFISLIFIHLFLSLIAMTKTMALQTPWKAASSRGSLKPHSTNATKSNSSKQTHKSNTAH